VSAVVVCRKLSNGLKSAQVNACFYFNVCLKKTTVGWKQIVEAFVQSWVDCCQIAFCCWRFVENFAVKYEIISDKL